MIILFVLNLSDASSHLYMTGSVRRSVSCSNDPAFEEIVSNSRISFAFFLTDIFERYFVKLFVEPDPGSVTGEDVIRDHDPTPASNA